MNEPHEDGHYDADTLAALSGEREVRSSDPPHVQAMARMRAALATKAASNPENDPFFQQLMTKVHSQIDADAASSTPEAVVTPFRRAAEPARRRNWYQPASLVAAISVVAIGAAIVWKTWPVVQPSTGGTGEFRGVGTRWNVPVRDPRSSAEGMAQRLRAANFDVKVSEQPGSWIVSTTVSPDGFEAVRGAVGELSREGVDVQKVTKTQPLSAGTLAIVFYEAL